MDHGHAQPMEIIGHLQGVVAADGDQIADAQVLKGVQDVLQAADFLGIFEILHRLDLPARIGPRGAQKNTANVANFRHGGVEMEIVDLLHQRIGIVLFKFLQVLEAVVDADDRDVLVQERQHGGRDDGVGRRSGPAGEQDTHLFSVLVAEGHGLLPHSKWWHFTQSPGR